MGIVEICNLWFPQNPSLWMSLETWLSQMAAKEERVGAESVRFWRVSKKLIQSLKFVFWEWQEWYLCFNTSTSGRVDLKLFNWGWWLFSGCGYFSQDSFQAFLNLNYLSLAMVPSSRLREWMRSTDFFFYWYIERHPSVHQVVRNKLYLLRSTSVVC